MKKYIKTIHVSFGDWSIQYRVGDQINGADFGKIVHIEFDQHDSINYDKLTYNIYAEKHGLEETETGLAKKIQGLPVEVSYGYKEAT